MVLYVSGTTLSTGENKCMQSWGLNGKKGIWHLFSSDYIKTGPGADLRLGVGQKGRKGTCWSSCSLLTSCREQNTCHFKGDLGKDKKFNLILLMHTMRYHVVIYRTSQKTITLLNHLYQNIYYTL